MDKDKLRTFVDKVYSDTAGAVGAGMGFLGYLF